MALAILAVYTARPGQEQTVHDALVAMTAASRAEPGCLDYRAHRDPEDSARFLLYERYTDQDAVDAHRASAHFERYVQGQAIPVLESREVSLWQTSD